MSQWLETLEPGAKVLMEGPKGLLNYLGNHNFMIRKKPVTKSQVALLAGGTGITPCY